MLIEEHIRGKYFDIIPVFKKENRSDKSNYRPVSILPSLSKLYERIIFAQMSEYMDKILSKYQCGFRKGISTLHSLIAMIEQWRKTLDKGGGACGALLTDLSKAFDCMKHDLLIAKLKAYGFNTQSLKLINSYLPGRKHRTKIGSSFSEWLELLVGVPQGSVLGPLFFNIFICDLFLFIEDTSVTSYADDTTPYACEKNSELVISKLTISTEIIFTWFSNNNFKCNTSKSHLMLTSSTIVNTYMGETTIKNCKQVKLLGIHLDNTLSFNNHVTMLCDRISSKLHAMARLSNFMNENQLKTVMRTFITSQFGYCPLIWMHHSRTLNNRINRLHERALRIVYKEPNLPFKDLLIKDNSVSIHHRNLQVLVTEMYKIKNNLSPTLMYDVFKVSSNPYNTRRGEDSFKTRNVKSVKYGTETLSYLGPLIWQEVPEYIRQEAKFMTFHKLIKQWRPKNVHVASAKLTLQILGSFNF